MKTFPLHETKIAVVLMIAALCWPANRTAAGGAFTIIATNGTPVPEGNGTMNLFTPSSFLPPVINDAGQVAFQTGLTGPGVNSANDTGIYRVDSHTGTVTKIAREGDPAPEGDGSLGTLTTIISSTYYPSSLNATGQVLFYAPLTGTLGGTNNSGIYRGNGSIGGLTNIARLGQATPDNNGRLSGFTLYPTLNDKGEVAFFSYISGTVNPAQDQGVFRGWETGRIQVARKAYSSDYGDLGHLGNPALNATGQTAFVTAPHAGPTYGFSGILRNDGGNLTLISYNGGPAPGGGVMWQYFSEVSLNDAGQVAFRNSIQSGGSGVFRSDGNTITKIAREGDTIEGGLIFANVNASPSVPLNNAGQVVFAARLAGPGVVEGNNNAIYRSDGTPGSLKQIAREGQAAPDSNGYPFRNFSPGSETVAMNERGQIVFQTGLTDFSSGIYFYDDRLGLLKVIHTGDSILGGTVTQFGLYSLPHMGRQQTPLNNRGQVVFWFSGAGTQGIAVWNLPQLKIIEIARLTNDIRITWNTIAGRTNVVQATTNLASGNTPSGFSDISGGIVASGSGEVAASFTEIGGATNQARRYYRIKLLP